MMQAALFADLPQARARVREPVRDASVSDGCRWWLKRAWGAGPCVLWCMANPSDADANRDDPTMQRVMDFSLRWGFGSCVVINATPLISSAPDAAIDFWKKAVWDPVTGPTPECELWSRNIHECVPLLLATTTRVAAWGNCLPEQVIQHFQQSLAEACDADWGDDEFAPVEWLCLGTNSNGSPRHPLSRGKNRVPDDFKAVKWERRASA